MLTLETRALAAAPPWWRAHGYGIRLHLATWSAFRTVAVACAFAPVALVVLRPRIHGGAVPAGAGWTAGALAAGAALLALWQGALVLRSRGAGQAIGRELRVQFALQAAFTVGYALATGAFLLHVATLPPERAGVFFTRALALSSGVAPIVPLVLGGLLLVAWASWHLHRTALLRTTHALDVVSACPEDGDGPRRARELRLALTSMAHGAVARALLAVLTLFAVWLALQLERTPETIALGRVALGPWRLPSAFDWLLRTLLVAGVALPAWSLRRMVGAWALLRARLRALETASWVDALDRLPRFATGLGRVSPVELPSEAAVSRALAAATRARWGALATADPAATQALRAAMLAGTDVGPAAAAAATVGDGGTAAAPLPPPLHGASADVVALGHAFAALRDRVDAAPAGAWRTAAEELAAIYVVNYVEWAVRHLRYLALFLLAALVLVTMLLGAYPFEPQSLVKVVVFALLVWTVGALLAVLVQVNRDPVLSRITHTTIGKVTWDAPFVLNLVLVGALPALTFLGSQFPELREFLFAWVTPVLKAFGRG